MDGIRLETTGHTALCIVEELSEELKQSIRKHLTCICHGSSRGTSNRQIYSYPNTLKAFIRRYDRKTKKTKKGMMGELLSHIIIIEKLKIFKTISPFFNMEEESIKKAFDLVLLHKKSNSIYFTEVKSGHAKNLTSETKNKKLLNKAKNDLKNKLNENRDTHWLNAINGATIALENNKNLKETITNILENFTEDAQNNIASSKSKKALIISVLYNNLSDKLDISHLQKIKKEISAQKIFKTTLIFSIQKHTYKKIENFLKDEINNETD